MYRVLILMFSCASAFSQSYDMVIGNGKIIDGTGNSWFYGDVAIKDGKIISIGKFDRAQTQYYIDAKGLMVAPGFIDVHTHVESSILNVPTTDNFV
ncbi:MAG: amidohydrolase family protein [Cyclobacteriaceae bacterium]